MRMSMRSAWKWVRILSIGALIFLYSFFLMDRLHPHVKDSQDQSGELNSESTAEEGSDLYLDSQERKMYPDLHTCITKPLAPSYRQHGAFGEYYILENYIPADLSFRCNESVTLTTHSDYTYLDNLHQLTARWQGPISVSIYAPGADFNNTIETILNLRDCSGGDIKRFVTFHLYFPVAHKPKEIPSTKELLGRKSDCSLLPPDKANITTYRNEKDLLYPVNIGRNSARIAAQTYFVFPNDIELYPSTNFIPDFLKMLKKKDFSNTTAPRVYVFSIFESNDGAPVTKDQLQAALKAGTAIPFGKNLCPRCHTVPMAQEWFDLPYTPGLKVTNVGKRIGRFKSWEPIYVGTNKEPLFDERLTWEGMGDKQTQMYVLCNLDYEFHILDNAFLVHRPGPYKVVKGYKDAMRQKLNDEQKKLIKHKLVYQYNAVFGYSELCKLW